MRGKKNYNSRKNQNCRLNADLARAAVYDKLVQKRITALADIRNNSDHGHFDKYTAEDVEDMIKWVKRFSADYLH